MPLDPAANFVRGATDASVDSAQTTISVVDASLFPDPSTDGAYNLVLWDADTHPRPDQDGDVEIVRVTARDTTADELTVNRGQEGTTGAPHPSGSALQLSPAAKMFSDIAGTFNEFYDSATQELTADVNNQSVSADVLNSADLTAGAEGDALTLTDNPPELALGTAGAEIIVQDEEPPVTEEGEAIWAQFVVDGMEATGAEQDWQHELHDSTVYSVFESNGVVYSGSIDDTVIAADATDGTEIWQHELHTTAVWSVFESDGVVYSGSNDDTVIAAGLVG